MAAGGSWRARAGLLAWCLALAGGTVLFHRLGDGPLAPPPLAPDAWAAWAEGRDPLVATVAVLRLVVLGLSWYLVGATSIGVLARALRAARLIRLADVLTVAALRRLLQAALGASLATTMVVSAATPRADLGVDAGSSPSVEVVDPDGSPQRDGAVTFAADRPWTDGSADAHPDGADPAGQVRLTASDDGLGQGESQVRLTASDDESSQVTITGVDDEDATEGLMRRPPGLDLLEPGAMSGMGGPDGIDEGGPDDDGSPDVDDAHERAAAADGEASGRGHTVATGESFWRIADGVLADHLDRPPTDREVAAYVERVVEHNRGRLADPENPDLIFPGQTFDLPPVASVGDA